MSGVWNPGWPIPSAEQHELGIAIAQMSNHGVLLVGVTNNGMPLSGDATATNLTVIACRRYMAVTSMIRRLDGFTIVGHDAARGSFMWLSAPVLAQRRNETPFYVLTGTTLRELHERVAQANRNRDAFAWDLRTTDWDEIVARYSDPAPPWTKVDAIATGSFDDSDEQWKDGDPDA